MILAILVMVGGCFVTIEAPTPTPTPAPKEMVPWLPPMANFPVQSWERTPRGGGLPPEPVVYESQVQKYPPALARGDYNQADIAHAYQPQNSPYFPIQSAAGSFRGTHAPNVQYSVSPDLVALQAQQLLSQGYHPNVVQGVIMDSLPTPVQRQAMLTQTGVLSTA
jgi:hypothetical protein